MKHIHFRKKHYLFVIPLILIIGIGLNSCAGKKIPYTMPAQNDYQAAIEYLNTYIMQQVKDQELMGLSIAVVTDQKILWQQGFGYADLAHKISVTPHTLFDAASVTKLFTATAVMQLVEQGKIALDQPLVAYLPEFAMKSHDGTSSDQITVRQLLTHHAGLPADRAKGFASQAPGAWTRYQSRFTQLPVDLHDEYLTLPPDYAMSYSNIGYGLLGALIDRVSGQSYVDYLHTAVLEPIGMMASGFDVEEPVRQNMAKGYRDNQEITSNYERGIPAGCLLTNAPELARFMQAYLDPRNETLVSNQTKQAMFTRQNAGVARDIDFQIGLSWFLHDFGFANLGTLAFHDGGETGFSSLLMIAPQERIGVVLLTNTDSAHEALYAIAREALKVAFETTTGTPVAYRPNPRKIELSNEELDAFEGEYVSEILGLFEIHRHKSGLRATVNGKTYTLIPHEHGKFGITTRMFGIIPVTLPMELGLHPVDGDIIAPLSMQGITICSGKRIVRPAPSEIWQAREGQYELLNAEDDLPLFVPWFNIRYDLGLLQVETEVFGQPFALAAIPQTPDYALTAGLGRRAGETLLFEEKDGTTYITYSGYVYRKI